MKAFKPLMSIAAAIVVLSACSKYEEGPGLSLRSKTARVSNEWKITYAYDLSDSVIVSSDYMGETWTLDNNKVATEMKDGMVNKTGTWEFVGEKEGIVIRYGLDADQYTIVMLKENEMWLRDNDEELHLVSVD